MGNILNARWLVMWLTEQEAQKYLKVSRGTLRRLEEAGKVQVYRVGGQRLRRYRKEDLDAVMEPEVPRVELWQRFSKQARRAILLAHNGARRNRVDAVDTSHLLAGLLRLRTSVAAQALSAAGISPKALQNDLGEQIKPGTSEKKRKLGFSSDAQEVLRQACAEAQELGSSQIDTGHLLLGLAAKEGDIVCQLLANYGVDRQNLLHLVQMKQQSFLSSG